MTLRSSATVPGAKLFFDQTAKASVIQIAGKALRWRLAHHFHVVAPRGRAMSFGVNTVLEQRLCIVCVKQRLEICIV